MDAAVLLVVTIAAITVLANHLVAAGPWISHPHNHEEGDRDPDLPCEGCDLDRAALEHRMRR